MKGFEQAKARALLKLGDTAATKVTLPFVEEQVRAARALMGEDFWAYGLEPNRHVLEVFLRRHHAEGSVAARAVARGPVPSLHTRDIPHLTPSFRMRASRRRCQSECGC